MPRLPTGASGEGPAGWRRSHVVLDRCGQACFLDLKPSPGCAVEPTVRPLYWRACHWRGMANHRKREAACSP